MQILLNFLSNSIKFTSSGKRVQLNTTIIDVQEPQTKSHFSDMSKNDSSGDDSDRYVDKDQDKITCSVCIKIQIKDEGIGIAEDNLDKLFIDFGKLD